MTVIPCEKDAVLKRLIEEFAETLQVEAHKLGSHGMSEKDFYEFGLFRGPSSKFAAREPQRCVKKETL